jgi:hypothetical protein
MYMSTVCHINELMLCFPNWSSFQKYFIFLNVFWKLINHSISFTMLRKIKIWKGEKLREDKSQREKWATLIRVLYASLKNIFHEIVCTVFGWYPSFPLFCDRFAFYAWQYNTSDNINFFIIMGLKHMLHYIDFSRRRLI